MDQVSEAFWGLLAGAFSAEHWPFLTVGFTLAILGQVASSRIFTREQAYRRRPRPWQHALFWWGRETLPAHPILVGLLLAVVWRDPEGKGWRWAEGAAYWAFCGATSLFVWLVVKAVAKHRGIVLTLPGESERPGRLPPEDTSR